ATATGILPTPALPVPNRPRFHHLFTAEIVERREKGLCFSCDQRFSRNHNCRARFSLLIAEEDDPVVEGDIATSDQDLAWATALDEAQLSLHAMSGIQAAQTFRVTGLISHQPVHVLVDGGSTSNFIQTHVVHSLGLFCSPSPTLKVLVGSGEELLSTQ
ncbi:hypothetical protein A2U01_0036247, partial [Trifolium medium]|nr:hypothetical protein [Trifolium medium]